MFKIYLYKLNIFNCSTKLLFTNTQRRVYLITFKVQQHDALISLYITLAASMIGIPKYIVDI